MVWLQGRATPVAIPFPIRREQEGREMICKSCAEAADKNIPKLHKRCTKCDCQHRVIVGEKIKDNNGDGKKP